MGERTRFVKIVALGWLGKNGDRSQRTLLITIPSPLGAGRRASSLGSKRQKPPLPAPTGEGVGGEGKRRAIGFLAHPPGLAWWRCHGPTCDRCRRDHQPWLSIA